MSTLPQNIIYHFHPVSGRHNERYYIHFNHDNALVLMISNSITILLTIMYNQIYNHNMNPIFIRYSIIIYWEKAELMRHRLLVFPYFRSSYNSRYRNIMHRIWIFDGINKLFLCQQLEVITDTTLSVMIL